MDTSSIIKNAKEILTPLVTEQVLKWTRHVVPNNSEGLPYYANVWMNEQGEKTKPVNFWNPAFDLKDAWVVLEDLKTRGIYIGLQSINGGFQATCDGEVKFIAQTAPLAICIASLHAVGIEVEESQYECVRIGEITRKEFEIKQNPMKVFIEWVKEYNQHTPYPTKNSSYRRGRRHTLEHIEKKMQELQLCE